MSRTGIIPDKMSGSLKEEIRRQQERHMKKHGSILFCPERNTICTFMFGAWEIGCQRALCIKDDMDNIALQKRIEIRRLEKKSQEAYHNNKPKQGDALFAKARFLRGELKKWEDERKKVENAINSL